MSSADPRARPSPAEILSRARQIDQLPDRLPVHVLASFSAAFVMPYLKVEALALGVALDVTVGPFNQFEQEVENASSQLWARENRAVLLLLRPEDVDPDAFASPDPGPHLERLATRVESLLGRLRAKGRATLIVANAAAPATVQDAAPSALADALADYNRSLRRAASSVADCHVFDFAAAVATLGHDRSSDLRMWYLAHMPFTQEAAAFLGRRLARRIASLFVPRAKCVVLDLDDTLWGGVIGDDGLAGIQLGDDYPGSAFKDFQRRLSALTHKGVLLAIVSKNYESVVRELFEKHPEMVLRWQDFSAHRINWDSKAENIREIARELNIGRDSLVFLDNDPLECATVQRELPEVHTVCMGRDPLKFAQLLDDIAVLDRPTITAEDRARVGMMRESALRREQEAATASPEEFLRSLKMVATVSTCDASNLARIGQLIGKTNQWNLTTRRRSSEQVRALAESPDAFVGCLRLGDVYGDLGLVCVGILTRLAEDPGSWCIDTLLMSCRVMNRGTEDAFLAFLAEAARQKSATRLIGEFIPSPKNEIVRDFYPRHGFVAIGDFAKAARYSYDLARGELTWPDQIARSP